jgi:hypothetical protein
LQLADELRREMESQQVNQLKKAIGTLDAATQDLAALVVERALAAADQPKTKS